MKLCFICIVKIIWCFFTVLSEIMNCVASLANSIKVSSFPADFTSFLNVMGSINIPLLLDVKESRSGRMISVLPSDE